jgi:pSer/pThr/pTyr-binding forkhead associated (FHA) protein
MVQLNILSGKTAGSVFTARRFPFSIGRAAGVDLRLEEDGVWDRHAQLRLDNRQGFVIEAQTEALLSVNGEPCPGAVLRNGDTLELGSAKARFWLTPVPQRRLAPKEALVWFTIAAVSLGQVALIYWMVR